MILPLFERRFPGMKITHVDTPSDLPVARAVSEARGGKTIGDVLQIPLENVIQAHDQGLLLDMTLPESAEYPVGLKGSFWTSSICNILSRRGYNLVKKDEDRKPTAISESALEGAFDRRTARPGNALGLRQYRFKSDEKAIEYWRKIATHNVEFHNGHSQLAELLLAGQAAVCLTCYSHHYPIRIKKGGR